MLYSIKQIPQEILNNVNNQEPDPCYVCNAPILQQVFNKNLALILLPCGHIHHDKCIKTLNNGSHCPFPYCTEVIENAYFANMQAMQSMQSMLQNIQTNITNIQIQPQEAFQQKELERCRRLNSHLVLGSEAIHVVPNKFDKYPQRFPSSLSQLRRLTGPDVDTFLEFYGLPTNGLVKDRRERLARYIGIDYLGV
ncbi:hypothetical protein RclHR1_09370008 [Rhizophagus clarus]|uniref:RING-type domain-containing protein n=1 Tax=Rhizophagus clarus TaxID=94130 RepID=A0A2Z6S429_9GLOM|nr:hypothetical protein RclHR1_09370008 [Rhizophagus clarus]